MPGLNTRYAGVENVSAGCACYTDLMPQVFIIYIVNFIITYI